MTRYFIHPESSCIWAQSDDAPANYDEDQVDELDKDQYIDQCNSYGLTPKEENGDPLT